MSNCQDKTPAVIMRLPSMDGLENAFERLGARMDLARDAGDVHRLCRLIKSYRKLSGLWRELNRLF